MLFYQRLSKCWAIMCFVQIYIMELLANQLCPIKLVRGYVRISLD